MAFAAGSAVSGQYGPRIAAITVSAPGTVSGTTLVQAATLGWAGN